MNSFPAALKALPLDASPDTGPRRRGGLFSFALAISLGLLSLALGTTLYREQHATAASLCLLAFGIITFLALWSLLSHLRHRDSLPRSHSVLTDQLGFRIDFTCGDVAMTAFLDPDTLEAGKPAKLLCFLENYASRQRVAQIILGPHPQLGLTAPLMLQLHLAAGQAAVYVLPLQSAAELSVGDHDLPIAAHVTKPTGAGALLPGARHHLHNLRNVHFAAPFTIRTGSAAPRPTADTTPLPTPGFHSLASVNEKQPRLEVLNSFPVA